MTDIQDLKATAERCKAHQPLRFMQSYGALYIRNDNGIVFDVHQNRSFPDFIAQNKDYADLVLAANPTAVLELFAEIEGQAAQFKEWQASHHANYCAAADERDQLKTENTDLHATLRAAKGEIERLKVENEALRKDAERYRWLRAETSSGPNIQVSEWVGPHEYRLHGEELDVAIDDALSKEANNG